MKGRKMSKAVCGPVGDSFKFDSIEVKRLATGEIKLTTLNPTECGRPGRQSHWTLTVDEALDLSHQLAKALNES